MKANPPPKDLPQKGNENAAPVVLVGTYREVNAEWIRARKCYNLPLPDELDATDEKALDFHRRFTHVVLYSHDHAPIVQRVRFTKVVGQKELTKCGYKPPKPPHLFRAERYALYEFTEKTAVSRLLADPQVDVFVVSSRCPSGLKIDADFYAKPLPDVGGQSIPNIFEKLKPYFKKWHSAVAFNPVQLDFFASLGEELVPFPAPEKGKFTFIDLFAGVGGFRLAMQEFGGKCVFSSEWDPSAQETYERNYGERPYGDITKDETKAAIPESFDVLCGGFPCQPFSLAGVSARTSLKKKHGFEDTTQGTLFFDIMQIVRVHHPKVLFLENVKNLVRHDNGKTFRIIKESIEAEGYSFNYCVIDASSLVPQKRLRCYMVCVRDGGEFKFPSISGPERQLASILEKDVPDSFTISDGLWAGHQRRTRKNIARGTGFTAFTADVNKPAHTLVARYYKDGKECLIPQKGRNPRMLTPRECARLQGFPERFVLPTIKSKAYKQMGNSVAVPVLKEIAKNICSQILSRREAR